MAAPPPQAVPPPSSAALEWTEADEPRSSRFGDVYFSRDDGLAETRAVFLDGCGLPDAWGGRRRFTVAELGLGTGLNVLALLGLWRRTRPEGGRLHVFSVEGFPMQASEARRALSAWPELADLADLMLDRWPDWTPGFHRIDLPELGAVLDVAIGDAAWALDQWQGRADAWFLDGFSPALNPEMWSEAVLDGVAARSAPGARLATFTVAGAVRRGLAERGFGVEKRPGHGRKRERLEARFAGTPAPEPRPTVAVIGTGIAGASVARALEAQGLSPIVLEAERPGAGGSGFPAALVTPRLDAGDALIAGFHAQALARAADLYRRIEGAVTAEGVLQLEQAERDATRFDKVAAQTIWPAGAMRRLDAAGGAARLGEATPASGLLMQTALAVRPAVILDAFLDGIEVRRGEVARIEASPRGWITLDANGAELSCTDALVLTSGWGNAALAPELGLSPVRGQADWIQSDTPPAPAAWGGYVAPTPDGFLFGATHDRGQTDTEPRAADTGRNLETLSSRLPQRAAEIVGRPTTARAAVRATTNDRLPVCGALSERPGLFILGGLGSRGLCVAPLLGEHLAALIAETPSPVARDQAERLRPDRLIPRG
ncbi:FAD-dependent 5-carboxymethylaminomethyl-2-thiouridine(34) oxidoreductase MnmC [Brevundimonas sp.]|uniref:FAD-dependent 5-carboxymethylaminomethyl-2-thiouridine(34) oxidoreductase MnmC n=1 Tax=Brevundimonas sp. TaxID=1871086 RepID=UPI004034802F